LSYVKKKKSKKPRRQVRHDNIPPIIDDMAINQDDGVNRVTSVKYQIYEKMNEGQEYVASKVGKTFHITRRRALEKLTELEEEGLLQSTYDLLRFEKSDGSFSVAKTRIFSKI
tara:strand:+ start:1158 stop:1496 length:339 start_codon:yes stop_codon:yes gene_type:complete